MSAVLSIDLARLQKKKERGGKIIGQCPECAATGGDSTGEHFVMLPSGVWGCAKYAGDHAHRQRIFALIGNAERSPSSGPALAIRPRPAPKPVDLLAKIKADFPASLYDLWDGSPIVPDEDLDDAKMFLRLFPADAILWIGKDIFQTGKPEHAQCFRTREAWQKASFTAPGTRIAPSSFNSGSYSRSAATVAEHLFVIVESDEIGEGKLYADKDQFCSLIRWLREACGWHLAAVVDSGGKSLHGWFRHPGATEMEHLREHATSLGLDAKFSEPSQPWRLPGPRREGSDTRQQLVYLNLEGSI